MVSEILFGEQFDIIERSSSWLKVKLLSDGYEGWLEYTGTFPTADVPFNCMVMEPGRLTSDKGSIELYTGAKVGLGETLMIGKERFQINARVNETPKYDAEGLLSVAKNFLHTPYYWGGRTSRGIDCSGFVQNVFSVFGIQLPRDAYQQVELGDPIAFEDAQVGDLAFFTNEKGRVTHVGIITEPGKIIHASERVRIDHIDEEGIWRSDQQRHSHQLSSIKRIAGL